MSFAFKKFKFFVQHADVGSSAWPERSTCWCVRSACACAACVHVQRVCVPARLLQCQQKRRLKPKTHACRSRWDPALCAPVAGCMHTACNCAQVSLSLSLRSRATRPPADPLAPLPPCIAQRAMVLARSPCTPPHGSSLLSNTNTNTAARPAGPAWPWAASAAASTCWMTPSSSSPASLRTATACSRRCGCRCALVCGLYRAVRVPLFSSGSSSSSGEVGVGDQQ